MNPMHASGSFLLLCFHLYRVADEEQVGQHYKAEGDSVPAESFEVVRTYQVDRNDILIEITETMKAVAMPTERIRISPPV